MCVETLYNVFIIANGAMLPRVEATFGTSPWYVHFDYNALPLLSLTYLDIPRIFCMFHRTSVLFVNR